MIVHKNLSSVARRFLFGAAVLLAASSAAVAEPVTLNCSSNSPGAAGTANIILDDAAGTITIYYPPMNIPSIPSTLMGKFAAKFLPDEITFQDEEGNSRTLNRSTGILEWYGTAKHPISSQETCHLVQKQF